MPFTRKAVAMVPAIQLASGFSSALNSYGDRDGHAIQSASGFSSALNA